MGKKISKNLQKVQDMVDGNYQGKIIVGALPENVHANRKVGDKWTDSDGVEWEQKEGYRSKISKVNKGLWETCNDCEKPIIDKFDKKCYNLYTKCHYCQLDFEAKLKTWPYKWQSWVRLQQLLMMDSVDTEMQEAIFSNHEHEKKLYDMSVANALANDNLDASALGKRRK